MTSWEPRQLVSKAAKQYAALCLVEFDLRQVEECCVELIRMGYERHNVVANALIDSALIRYRRCFNEGRRTRLTHLIERLTPEQQALHSLLLTIANNHTAHSSNDYEVGVATVMAAKVADGQLRRGGIGAHMHFTVPLSQQNLGDFVVLAKRLQHEVASVMDKLKDKLRTEVERMSDGDFGALDGVMDLFSAQNPPDEHRSWPPRKAS